MFHTAAAEAELTVTWQNSTPNPVEIAWSPAGGQAGHHEIPAEGTYGPLVISMPEAELMLQIGALPELNLILSSSGTFSLGSPTNGWVQNENTFSFEEANLTFNYSRSGIVIVGILDIGGAERG
jgi:hypothetical protein